MKTFQLTAEPRTDLGKKAAKALRKEEKIPVVLNGGEVFTLPYTGTLREGEKIVEIGNNQGLITTDLAVTNDAVRKLIYTPTSSPSSSTCMARSAWLSSRISSSTP